MGPTAFDAGVGSWGEPRRAGYEDNWARYGITSDGSLAAGAHTGLAQGVTLRGVSHAAIYIGGNDFSPWAGAYDEIYNQIWNQADIDNWIASRVLNYRTFLDTLAPTGVRLVLMSVMDFSSMPYVWQEGGFTDPLGRERVNAAMIQLRDELRDLADESNCVFLDTYALNKAIFGENTDLRTALPVGNTPIALTQRDSGSSPATGWVFDGIHPNTVLQGIWANAVLTALNFAYDTDIALFTEAEILAHDGMPYGGSDTLTATIGPLQQYILNFAPPFCVGDADGDRAVAFSDITAVLANFGAMYIPGTSGSPGDSTGGGTVDFADVTSVLANWGAACD
jgi:lysophospholipase L1-like esterase